MWPFLSNTHEIVSIGIRPESIVCSWITSTKKSRAPYILRAYERMPIDTSVYNQGILFNFTTCTSFFKNFLEKHNITRAFITCSLSGSHITEFILDTHSASPATHEFPLQKLNKLMWDYRYLYPKEDARYALYACGISRQLLAQYQLLALSANLNLTLLTTEFMTHLEAYKHLYGKAFRRAQLARDMLTHDNRILSIFTQDTLRRILTIDPSLQLNSEHEKENLITALGLFLIGKSHSHE
jgi:hypothetical protein